MKEQNAPQLTVEQKIKTVTFLTVALVFVWIFFVPSCSKEEKFVPTKENAYIMSQHFVKEKLKSPSTAEFPASGQAQILSENENTWVITSYVDSQNAFGAMLRTVYTCTITYEGEIATCKDLRFVNE